jgi:uncharacterized protein (TIGR03086 family)
MHARAQTAFGDVLALVGDGDLSRSTPCTNWTVADLIGHVRDGNQWVVELGGSEPNELPSERLAAHAASSAAAQAVFGADDGLTRTFDHPIGPIPGSLFATIRAGDAYAHAWDLATAIGADTDIDGDLGEEIYDAISPLLGDGLRGEGRPFGPRQPCPQERPMADRVAAFLGRTVT